MSPEYEFLPIRKYLSMLEDIKRRSLWVGGRRGSSLGRFMKRVLPRENMSLIS
jgi:hypothetical protein